MPEAAQLPEDERQEIVLNCALNSKAFLIDTDKVGAHRDARGKWRCTLRAWQA